MDTGSYKTFLCEVILGGKTKFDAREEELLTVIRKERISRPIIFIGMGTCGLVAGADHTFSMIQKYLAGRDIDADIVSTGCIGFCNSEPIVDIQLPGKTRIAFKKITEDKVNSLLDDIFHGIISEEQVLWQFRSDLLKPWDKIPFSDEIPFFRYQHRVVLGNTGIIDPFSIEEYIAKGGFRAYIKSITSYSPDQVCDIIDQSGLRGRAGGGFSSGKKWKSALASKEEIKYLICNAEESDQGAFMDRAIIEGDPFRIMEGIAIASYATGVSKAIIYIRSEYHTAIERLIGAIKNMKDYGLSGEKIWGTNFNLQIEIRQSPGTFICGEETALINTLEGKRGMPRHKPPYPVHSGLFNKPTLVNNVETLANVASIIEYGPKWFYSIGTVTSKGTKVFSISGNVNHIGLVEVKMGTTLKDIIYTIAGGMKEDKKIKAVHIGGPLGSSLPADCLDTKICYESLKEKDAEMGSGGLIVLNENNCMIDLVHYFMNFMQKQSCGKCIPCREGTRRMSEIFDHIIHKPVDHVNHTALDRFRGVIQLEALSEVMKDTSLCGFGVSAPNPFLSILKYFRKEFEEHLFDRKCRAGVCKELRLFMINIDQCTGCSICAKKCPENAIIGTPKSPYFIVEEKCTGCGICSEVCAFGAVYLK